MIQGPSKTVAAALVAAGVLAAASALAQSGGHQHPSPSSTAPAAGSAATAPPATAPAAGSHEHGATPSRPAGRVVQEGEVHAGGGVPRGWKFTLPAGGDVARGRTLFADLECYKCHVVKDGGFPPLGADGKKGPELTGMGRHHPAEYFAESILDPSAVILDGPGHIGPDGRSIMPSYADSLSVTQLLDLVAYIRSLDSGAAVHHESGESQDRTVGPYRIRLTFAPAGAHHGAHHGAGGHHAHHGAHHGAGGHHAHGGHHAPQTHAAAEKAGARAGHLMVFVADAVTGEPVPYLPVSASVHAKATPSRTVRLAPMTGGRGFHYGADLTLPANTERIVLSIGATTMRVMGAERDRFARPHTVAFDWKPSAR